MEHPHEIATYQTSYVPGVGAGSFLRSGELIQPQDLHLDLCSPSVGVAPIGVDLHEPTDSEHVLGSEVEMDHPDVDGSNVHFGEEEMKSESRYPTTPPATVDPIRDRGQIQELEERHIPDDLSLVQDCRVHDRTSHEDLLPVSIEGLEIVWFHCCEGRAVNGNLFPLALEGIRRSYPRPLRRPMELPSLDGGLKEGSPISKRGVPTSLAGSPLASTP